MENLYCAGDCVWVTDVSCFAVIVAVRRPIGSGPYLYDIEHDDGESVAYVAEDELYPGPSGMVSAAA